MRFAAVVLLLLAVASSASAADVPAGFTSRAALANRASAIAGKQVRVYCANGPDEWAAFVASSGVTAAETATALTYPGESETYLADAVCGPLVSKTRKGSPPL